MVKLRKPTPAEFLLSAIVVCLLATFIAIVVVRGHQITTNRQLIDAQLETSYTNALNARESCKRGINSREKLLTIFDGIKASTKTGNQERVAAWRFYRDTIASPGQAVTGAPVEQFAQMQIDANQGELNRLSKVEPALLAWVNDATAGISAHPRSNDPHRVNLVDCAKAYPVPPKP